MKNVIAKMRSLYPVSDETVELLKARVTPCRFPKRYQLIKADEFCRSAYFIEEGMTRSFWGRWGGDYHLFCGRRKYCLQYG